MIIQFSLIHSDLTMSGIRAEWMKWSMWGFIGIEQHKQLLLSNQALRKIFKKGFRAIVCVRKKNIFRGGTTSSWEISKALFVMQLSVCNFVMIYEEVELGVAIKIFFKAIPVQRESLKLEWKSFSSFKVCSLKISEPTVIIESALQCS